MGQKLRRAARLDQTQVHSLRSSPFKVFEYACPQCTEKRSIQYFHRNGVFLEQTPKVVCGSCHTSIVAKPYKALEFECPMCRAARKVRVPAKPVPLERYDSSLVSCPCGFRGEAGVGRIMHLVCEQCLGRERQMVSTWTENGGNVTTYCQGCCAHTTCIAMPCGRKAKVKGDEDFVFTCGGCSRIRPLCLEDMVRAQGVVDCTCGWSGYPEHVESGADHAAALAKLRGEPTQPLRPVEPQSRNPGRPPDAESGAALAKLHGMPKPEREEKRFKRASAPGPGDDFAAAVPSAEPLPALRDKSRQRAQVRSGPATQLPKVTGPAAQPPSYEREKPERASFGALERLREKTQVASSAGPRLTSVLPRLGD